jgi:hypothetical protein
VNWPVLVGALLAVTLSSLGRLGGVRFDAETGLCEPGDASQFIGIGRTMVVGEDGKVTRAGGLPFPATCQLEVGGLAPGRYVVQVTPPRLVLPPYSVSFDVRAGQWTDVPLTLPPVIVRGRVTSNGMPVTGAVPNFSPSSGTTTLQWTPGRQPSAFPLVRSDDDGRYAVALWAPGTYTQSFSLEGQQLPLTASEVTLGLGVNVHDIEVGAGALRVFFTERGVSLIDPLTVRVTLHSLPQRPFVRTVRASSGPVDVATLAPGTYVVRATAERRSAEGGVISLVSAQQVDVTVSAQQSTDVTIDLVSREGWLEVVDASGRPLDGAAVVTYPGATSLRTDERGRVSLATLPIGARVPIRSRTWGVTCHVVTNAFLQRVTIADAAEEVVISVPHKLAGARPTGPEARQLRQVTAGASVSGLAGATCPLPIEAFSIAEGRAAGAVELTLMLPDGWYTLTLRDGRTFQFQAPGRIEIK